MNKFKRKNEYAFTLLEMLVAMAIMSSVAVSLYSNLYIAFKAKKTIQRTVEPIVNANIIFDYIKSDLLCAVSPGNVLSDTFTGDDQAQNDNDTLTFCTSNYISLEDEIACDICKVEYALEKIEPWQEFVLVRNKTTNLLSPNVVDPTQQIISRHVRAFDIQYYDGYDWTDNWSSSSKDNELPASVLVTLTVTDGVGLHTSNMGSVKISREILLPENPSSSDDEEGSE